MDVDETAEEKKKKKKEKEKAKQTSDNEEEDKWEEVSGDDHCRTCVRDDTACVVNTTAIR